MSELYVSDRKIDSLFSLLGDKENDLSYSVGYALAQCPSLMDLFLHHVKIPKAHRDGTVVRMQSHERGHGFTDFELINEHFHMIIEAKRHWDFPSLKQLSLYANRSQFRSSIAPRRQLILLNACTSSAYANVAFPHTTLPGTSFPITSLSWNKVLEFAKKVNKRGREGWILQDLITYLTRVLIMNRRDSNLVYVVALSSKNVSFQGGNGSAEGFSSIDLYKQHGVYFHPLAAGWPVDAPNYVAFRFDGKLQGIHHVDSFDNFNNTHQVKELTTLCTSHDVAAHALYRLGPNILHPNADISTGKPNLQNSRVWIDIDLLLVNPTVADALSKSIARRS